MKLDNEATYTLMKKIAELDLSDEKYEDATEANNAIKAALENVTLREFKDGVASMPDCSWENSLKKGKDFHEFICEYVSAEEKKRSAPEEEEKEEEKKAPAKKKPASKAKPKKEEPETPKQDVVEAVVEKVVEAVVPELVQAAADASSPSVDAAFSAFRDSVFSRLDSMNDEVSSLTAGVADATVAADGALKRIAAVEKKVDETREELKKAVHDMEKNLTDILRKTYTEVRDCVLDPDRLFAPPRVIFGDKK